MTDPEVLAAIITAGITFAGIIVTIVYNFFRGRSEDKRHSHQIEVDERRSKLEENHLALELYNQREIKIFEARLESYPLIFTALLPLTSRDFSSLTPKNALAIEKEIARCVYTKVSHCLSTESLLSAFQLRKSLIQFASKKISIDELNTKRMDLLRALHKDLGRKGDLLGSYESLTEADQEFHRSVLGKGGARKKRPRKITG